LKEFQATPDTFDECLAFEGIPKECPHLIRTSIMKALDRDAKRVYGKWKMNAKVVTRIASRQDEMYIYIRKKSEETEGKSRNNSQPLTTILHNLFRMITFPRTRELIGDDTEKAVWETPKQSHRVARGADFDGSN
jgi:hypothetical protein